MAVCVNTYMYLCVRTLINLRNLTVFYASLGYVLCLRTVNFLIGLYDLSLFLNTFSERFIDYPQVNYICA